jgi:hypothetical protein
VNASRSEAFTESKDPEFASSGVVMQGLLARAVHDGRHPAVLSFSLVFSNPLSSRPEPEVPLAEPPARLRDLLFFLTGCPTSRGFRDVGIRRNRRPVSRFKLQPPTLFAKSANKGGAPEPLKSILKTISVAEGLGEPPKERWPLWVETQNARGTCHVAGLQVSNTELGCTFGATFTGRFGTTIAPNNSTI